MQNAFIDFSTKIKPNGCLIIKENINRINDFKVKDTCTYNINNSTANISVQNITINNGAYVFDVVNKYWHINNIVLNMGGLHNIENAIAAIGVAKYLNIDDNKIIEAVASFAGVKEGLSM